MSLYAGWLTSSLIVGFAMTFKKFGMSISNGWDEAWWTVFILWVGLVIYCTITFFNRDPLFGAVYIWRCIAIRDRIINIWGCAWCVKQLNVIIILMSVYAALVAVWVIVIKVKATMNRDASETTNKSFI